MKDETVLVPGSGATISGRVVNLHNSRPPDFTFWPGEPVPSAWVGLNELAAGLALGRCLYAAPANDDSTFAIPDVPPGDYQLAIWDDNLDMIFASKNVTVTADPVTNAAQDVVLGDVPIFSWFFRLRHNVFMDYDEDGFPDAGEPGILEQVVNLRFRDGSLYQSAPTDGEGFIPFDETFPFFNWLVTEVDFARFKATGLTAVVDAGGQVLPDQGWDYPSEDVLTPQPQFEPDGVAQIVNPHTGNNLSRTEVGPVLTQAFQGFLGQTSYLWWGKSTYDKVDTNVAPYDDFPGPGDTDLNGNGLYDHSNGGISGIVYYAATRAEDDARLNVADPWEPGIPRVPVNLYRDANEDGEIDDADGNGLIERADADHAPFGWADGTALKGSEDLDGDGDGAFDRGDAIQIATTDSWDDNLPSGTQGLPFYGFGDPTNLRDGFDGLRNYNQVRPGVFDGGYAFTSYINADGVEVPGLPEDTYIVEAVTPPGYLHQKEEDMNVVFGETYTPSVLQLPPPCVGTMRLVPDFLTLFPGEPCPAAGQMRPLPDMKQVRLARQQNAAADFFMFTEVPVAGHIVGIILDDTANEFDPLAPAFGEKYSPPFLPISVRDWTGKEIARGSSDKYGAYNFLVPSTFTADRPCPSGYSPNMLTVVLNSPGPVLDTRVGSPTYGQYITDPFFNRQYSQFAYTFNYMPGTTTYLDTPVVPIAAFAGSSQNPVDVEFASGTPVIWSASGPAGNGPYANGDNVFIDIISAGQSEVPNPLFVPDGPEPQTIFRDYGFGAAQGKVTIGGLSVQIISWTPDVIRGRLVAGMQTGQMIITRGDNGKATPVGLTFTIGRSTDKFKVWTVTPDRTIGATPIQDAIDRAAPGDLILLPAGIYEEMVIMWKPVQLQGAGLGTNISALKTPSENIFIYRQRLKDLIMTGKVDLLPGQQVAFAAGIEPTTLFEQEGAGILVLAANQAPPVGFGSNPHARIDGLTISGADTGGGININGYAPYLEISNNRIASNSGFNGGGITIGHPNLLVQAGDTLAHQDSYCDGIRIHHNQLIANGSQGVGGGVALYTGADACAITDNWIAGNFALGGGGGISHYGLSDHVLIEGNTIIFNQSFNQGLTVSGGGILISGAAPVLGTTLTPGAGNVMINDNLIQGNQAGVGDGGGIRLEAVNGLDVVSGGVIAPSDQWFRVDICNNQIVNNVAGLAAGGISIQDAARVHIVQNTIARNDSTATAGPAFTPGNPNESIPHPAGVVLHANSQAFATLSGMAYAQPVLDNNIIYQNRSMHFVLDTTVTPSSPSLVPGPMDPPEFWDLAVMGAFPEPLLTPRYCVLTDITDYPGAGNVAGGDATTLFVASYYNGDRGQTLIQPETTTVAAPVPAFDEGGNFIDVRFGPLTLWLPGTTDLFGDYHIQPGSAADAIGGALDLTATPELARDLDSEPRPAVAPDAGADQYHTGLTAWNTAPVAVNTLYTVRRNVNDNAGTPNVLGNDTDADGDSLTVATPINNARLTLNADGSFAFRPGAAIATYNYAYQATDGMALSNPATITFRVINGNNTAPVANNDPSYSVVAGETLVVPAATGVLANDTDANGDTLLAVLDGANNVGGILTLAGDGSFVYTPNAGVLGPVTFTYYAWDTNRSNRATVTIDVTAPALGPNDPPVPSAAVITTVMDVLGIGRVLANDPNAGDYFTYAITVPAANGTAAVMANGVVTYMPNAGWMGADSFTVQVTDQRGASGVAIVDVLVVGMDMLMPPGGAWIQVPPDTDGVDTDGDGLADNDNIHYLLSAGDGFVKMADGRSMYMFGFGNLNDLLPTPSADTVLTTFPLSTLMMNGMLNGESSAPTITGKEGQKMYLNLFNAGMVMRPDLFDPHSVHFHGEKNASAIFDGVPEASVVINMGSVLTYFYQLDSPGTYLYHCHVEATEHMQMGMLGNLWIYPIQNNLTSGTVLAGGFVHETGNTYVYNDGDGSTRYDVEFPVQLGSFDSRFHDASFNVQGLPFALMQDNYTFLNGRGYPDTTTSGSLPGLEETGYEPTQNVSALITARKGEVIALRMSNVSVTRFYSLACALPMQVVGVDAELLQDEAGNPLYYTANSVELGGGMAKDVLIHTADVPAGVYPLYTTNMQYLSNNEQDFGGMMTEIHITE